MTSTVRYTLNVSEAAARIGVSPFTIRSWLRQRRLPYIRDGRRVLLTVDDVDNFLRTHRVEARDGCS